VSEILKRIEEQMVALPEGKVAMRDEAKKRSWIVRLSPFQIAKFPVTEGQYSLMNGSVAVGAGRDPTLPKVEISWREAVKFCNQLSVNAGYRPCYTISADEEEVSVDWNAEGYRLPSEAEWEYACRAGDKGVRYGELDAIAWYRDNSDGQRHPVGLKQPNAWGLFDTIGNVWEWCWDIYDSEVYRSYRVFRGGGWFDEPVGCRAACRRKSHPTFQIDDLGFRLARTVLQK
jgi:formylglycine-generating enzyme required for sulfatase activity